MSTFDDDRVLARLTSAVEVLGAVRTRGEALDRIVQVAAEVVPAAEHVSITLLGREGPATPVASGPLPRQVDALQYATGEGPCLAAARGGDSVLVDDLSAETRWPRFAARMAQQTASPDGARSMLALPLRAGSQATGSLNLSAGAPGAFTGPARAAGSFLAALAALALTAAAREERAALDRAQAETFTAGLAHDLRSGMTVALSAHEIVTERRALLHPQGREALDLLGEELARQRRVLVDLLDLARAQAGSLSAQRTALVPLVRDAVRQHRRRVPVYVEPGASSVLAAVHPIQLGGILADLLHNADVHAGGATAVRVGCTGDQAWVTVEDAEGRGARFVLLLPTTSPTPPGSGTKTLGEDIVPSTSSEPLLTSKPMTSGLDATTVMLSPIGELDLSTLPELRAQLHAALLTQARRVLVDLAEVTFLDAVTIGALASTASDLRRTGRALTIVNPGRFSELLRMTGLDKIIDMNDTPHPQRTPGEG